jgi:3D (Asp-Asp-Asp) domain-containing protein
MEKVFARCRFVVPYAAHPWRCSIPACLRILWKTVVLTLLAAMPVRVGGSPSDAFDQASDGLDSPTVAPAPDAPEPVDWSAEGAPALPVQGPPQPRWLTAWKGETPATQPRAAAAFNKQDPTAYEEWLLATLPSGCRVRREWATVTAYCPCAICCDERTGRTATGKLTDIHPYGIASDWRLLRRGTKLHVPGYMTTSTVGGVWEVDDTGGAMRRSRSRGVLHLDVRFMSHDYAERWGTRRMWVYVVTGPVVPR